MLKHIRYYGVILVIVKNYYNDIIIYYKVICNNSLAPFEVHILLDLIDL